jgi:hypothetical protein
MPAVMGMVRPFYQSGGCESRTRVIGMAIGVLFVITTLRGDQTCRIIFGRRHAP